MMYMLALTELLEMEACDAIGGEYYMPDDPEMLDFRVSAVLADKRKDPQYPALLEDIRVHGLRTPIWIHEGEINDGCHRIAAAQDLGMEYLPCTNAAPDDPEGSARVYDFATKTWTNHGWRPDRRPKMT
ncbi:ParB N-terminal domain-containing protein [Streptomyces sp. NPDC004728]|uniref:ParB N-terminal domain-containing protein n=1 Tax=Streptomyces sp. NPDC004728 TaxID=3154289 RepID=UPI0033B3422C